MLSTPDNEILAHHRIIEAFKFAYAKRSNLGDEEFVDVKNVSIWPKLCFNHPEISLD